MLGLCVTTMEMGTMTNLARKQCTRHLMVALYVTSYTRFLFAIRLLQTMEAVEIVDRVLDKASKWPNLQLEIE